MSLLELLLLLAVLFLVTKSAVLIRNRFEFTALSSCRITPEILQPTVAVCVPARNEENTLGICLDSVLCQNYPHLKVYVLNDRSTDGTGDIIRLAKQRFGDKLETLSGAERPAGWLGKPWACHQLSEATREDILVFADADTWLEPDAISKLVAAFSKGSQDFITVWPQQKTVTFWEKVIVPLVYYALLGFLPVKYTERKPRWMPAFFHQKFRTLFAAACGQFVAFRKETYKAIGGHTSVKNEVVEDVWLARNVLQQGFRMRMFHGVDAVHCRMYRSHEEIWNGFRKNFFAGFDNNLWLFLLMSVLHFLAYILPVGVLITHFFIPVSDTSLILALTMVGIFLIHRLLLGTWFRWPVHYGLLHSLGVIWFQLLAIRVLSDYFFRKPVTWKGEAINQEVKSSQN